MTLSEQLIRDEGLKLKPYRDTQGKLTIGVGRNLDDTGITREEALYLLLGDITRTQTTVFTLLPWIITLDEVRQAALLNLAFNVGPHGLLEFRKMLAAAQAGEWAAAGMEMVSSLWAQQVGARALRLQRQLDSGEWA